MSCLLGQNHGMACLLPKAGGDKGTEVLKNQSHVSAGTLRMEKDFKKFLREHCSGPSAPYSGRVEGDSHLGCVCTFRVGDRGLFAISPLDPLIPAPHPLLWKGGIGLSVIKWSYIFQFCTRRFHLKVVRTWLQRRVNYCSP